MWRWIYVLLETVCDHRFGSGPYVFWFCHYPADHDRVRYLAAVQHRMHDLRPSAGHY